METGVYGYEIPRRPSAAWEWKIEGVPFLENYQGERYYPRNYWGEKIKETKKITLDKKTKADLSLLSARSKESETVKKGRMCLLKSARYEDRTHSMNVNMLYGICGKDNYNEALRKYLVHVYIEI